MLRYLLLACCALHLFNAETLLAQNGQPINEEYRVSKVRFAGNSAVRNNTLQTLVRTKPNRELLSIPGFTVWYWLNQLNSRWGESPSRLDRQIVASDMERIKAYYTSIGYLDTSVDTIIVEFGERRYEVSFLIQEGTPARVNRVSYRGFPEFEDPRMLSRFYRRSSFARRAIEENDTTFIANRRFTYESISIERNNIIDLLRNNGYASVQRDSVRAIVERTDDDPYNLNVLFLIHPGPVYHFGDVLINLDGPANLPQTSRRDSVGAPRTMNDTKIIVDKDEEAYTRFSLLYNTILFTPGDRYNHELYLLSVRRFQNMGMINVRQFGLSLDGGLPDYSNLYLPVRIDMQTLPRHGLRFDVFGMQRLGLGAGAGFRYVNNNLLRGAETLEIGIKGSFENAPNVSTGILRSLEATAEFGLPRLTFPFGFLSTNSDFSNARTRYQLSLAQINQLNFDVNANLRFNLKYEVVHNSTTTSILDLMEFDWFDASPTPRFRDRIEQEITDPLQRERILNDFSQQFNAALRYTIRRTNTDIIKRNTGFYNEMSLEFAGTIPYLIERYLVRPGEPIQSTIPSFSLADSTLSYSRFVKAYTDHRQYYSSGRNSVFAFRGFAGIAYAYGQNTRIPLNRRFFAGGSNDIRGWPPLRLGPGDVSLSQVTVNGADIKLAAFTEARQTLLRNFLSTNWAVALFTDAGNIWNGPRSEFSDGKFRFDSFYKEFAVGTGFGIRLDWEYVVMRVDVAYRAYDPAKDNGIRRGWFNSSNSYIHFGIGHSF